MAIIDFLLTNLINEVWSNTSGDSNAVFKSTQLTTFGGAVSQVNLPFANIILPNNVNAYLLIELGDAPANLLGVQTPYYGWVPIETVTNNGNTMVLCFSQGRMFAFTSGYIQFIPNGNVLIALSYAGNQQVVNLKGDIYVRFYTNIFYTGIGNSENKSLQINSYTVTSLATAITYNTFNHNWVSLTNYNYQTLVFKNGLYCPLGLPAYSTLVNGDTIEYIYDPLIMDVTTYPVNSLPIYFSTTDSANKTIVSIDINDENIFVADLEFFISGNLSNGARLGVYLPRLDISDIRQLTYKDWAINSQFINSTLLQLNSFQDIHQIVSNVQIHVIRRNNGQVRAKFLDSNCIPDLLNLPSAYRTQALAGLNANLPLWRANTLEVCPLNTFIQLPYAQLNQTTMFGVYSRLAAVFELERVKSISGTTQYILPPIGGNAGGTLISFNSSGYNPAITTYNNSNYNTAIFDGNGYELFFPALNANDPLDIAILSGYNGTTIVDYGFDILCYYLNGNKLTIATLGIDYTLTDVTGSNGLFDGSTTITWSSNMHALDRYVRTAQKSIIFTQSFTLAQMTAGINVYNGRELFNDIGMGYIYVWCNGYYLIEGLDYVLHNSLIYITSKPGYWTNPATFTVVYAGLPNSFLMHTQKSINGFVKYGKILEDGIYDLYLYRDKLFFINGVAVTPEQIPDKENFVDEIASNGSPTFRDGLPFAIVDYPQFIRNDILDLVCPTLAAQTANDVAISGYLSVIDPQPIPNKIITIPNKYQLVSPMMNRLIDDIVNHAFIVPAQPNYTSAQIETLLINYFPMMAVDPSTFNVDFNFVSILPTWNNMPVDVTLAQYTFLNQVNQHVFNNTIAGLNFYLNVV